MSEGQADRLPGNRAVRRRRIRRETITVRSRQRRQFRPKPWMVPALFAFVILVGALLLALPFASEEREWTHWVDALFTSASAVCVTGLTRVDTADHWSGFGEVVIAVLFQAGGLGVTMYAGVLLVLFGNRIGLRGREFFGMELLDLGDRDIYGLLRRVMTYALAVEVTTFVLLVPWFWLQDAGPLAVWKSLFHAVSAFNNAGFDLQGGGRGFTAEVDNPYPVLVMGVSAFLGALSFITMFNMRRRPRRWTLDTRLVVIGMFGLLFAGTVIFLLEETTAGSALDGQSPFHAVVNSLFLAVNRTAGMTTIDLATIDDSTTAALLLLMFVGGASTSTASGIKVGTFMVSLVVVLSAFRGQHRATVFGRELPPAIVLRAVAVTIVGFLTLGAGLWVIELTDDFAFLPALFEVMSALGNVGWSFGITSAVSDAGAVAMTVMMFLGRLGPLYIALSIPDQPQTRFRFPMAGVRVG